MTLLHTGPALAAVSLPEDSHAAVILAYSRIGEDEYPDNNIRTEQFLAHVEEIAKGGYNVMQLPELVAALKKNETLPPRTICITFDGAFKSALENGIPALLQKNIPFTVFYAASRIDSPSSQYMTWDDLKNLAANKNVSIGILPASYERMAEKPEVEIRAQINKALQRHRDMMKTEPEFFSYPYGEYSLFLKNLVRESGFVAALGLHSGAASPSSDFYDLPRFPMTEHYGDLYRFQTAARTLPFPVTDLEPADPVLATASPVIGFSVPAALADDLKSISCLVSGQSAPAVEIIDARIELRPAAPLEDHTARINCTLPANMDENDTPRWRWLSLLLTPPGTEEEETQDVSLPPPALP
ncbi:MAG: polysaccharide deacetylase family protein [Alphaproteobacteria bacterium]|nr:polysaccharide deacetylase family protein [Alphaproteobacteria bacterium]